MTSEDHALPPDLDDGHDDVQAGGRFARPGIDEPFDAYVLDHTYDECFLPNRWSRPHYAPLHELLSSLPVEEIQRRQLACEQSFLHQGITFTVYGDAKATEKIIPTDLLPRIITGTEWDAVERGLKQRIQALNLFLKDIYHDAKVVKDGVIPGDLVFGAKHFRKEMVGVEVPRGAYVSVCGTDLIRDEQGNFAILEDNLRVPSGVSYMLANREVVRRAFPALFRASRVRPIEHYPQMLLETLRSLAPPHRENPRIVLLTPGVFNSAYYEHTFLARQMGIELVEGRDLVANDGHICMRTTSGLERVDVIYRRIDDDFADPLVFRPDSVLGVPGLFEAYAKGKVVVANAFGNGVADDKAVYAYVPKLIKYYLGEDAILGNIETYLCREPAALAHVLANLDKLVVKAVGESGGYGMLVGPHASAEERAAFGEMVKADPDNYIAQPTISLSRAPTFIEGKFEARHIDLRPFILTGAETQIAPGGLTRVALRRGSLVVNSSQGGGSKDTWVVED
ncbi:MAG: circularly permuted type 2 ATP-grasp protein [Micropepsaceae bacterium]